MAAPAVRELNSLISEIGQSVQPQKALIDADIASNAQAGEAQVAGLDATKDRTFGQIEQRASDKGMLFSGFSPDAQAEYTATSYLPALAQLQAQIAQTRSQLLGKKADLDTNVFNQAFQTREGDIGRKFTYDQAEADRAFQANQAEIQRRFTEAQNEKDRAQARALQAAQAKASAPRGPSTAAVVQSIVGELQGRAGKDGYVSPKTYNDARQAWVALGGKPADFDGTFRGFANPSHSKDYFLK